MIDRLVEDDVRSALARQAAVGIIGPRQVGKTTLALKIAEERPSVYLDLESPQDRAQLQEPERTRSSSSGRPASSSSSTKSTGRLICSSRCVGSSTASA